MIWSQQSLSSRTNCPKAAAGSACFIKLSPIRKPLNPASFICTIVRVELPEAAQQFVRDMNTEFADATHNCWAYVAGPPGSSTQIGMSDAGEPHGTAGRPMLTVLMHSNVGEIAAVVTRYYGGTKLGTGGLVKAYGGTVKLALESLPLGERVDAIDASISFGHAHVTLVRQLLTTLGAEMLEQHLGADVTYDVRIARSKLEQLERELAGITRGAGSVRTA